MTARAPAPLPPLTLVEVKARSERALPILRKHFAGQIPGEVFLAEAGASYHGLVVACGSPHPLAGTPMIASLSLAQALEFYENAVTGYLKPEMHPQGHGWRREFLRRFHGMSPHDALSTYLRRRNLACWCALPALGEPDHCHAAVLLRIANPRLFSAPVCDPLPTETKGRRE